MKQCIERMQTLKNDLLVNADEDIKLSTDSLHTSSESEIQKKVSVRESNDDLA